MPPVLPASFTSKKAKILSLLSTPVSEYDDLSPKGSVDEGIRELIDEINLQEGWVTTSSCAGRVSVYLDGGGGGVGRSQVEGGGREEDGSEVVGGDGERKSGGKGGGRWLFVSHDVVDVESGAKREGGWLKAWGIEEGQAGKCDGDEVVSSKSGQTRLIHFKFEPMILHVLTATPDHAQAILSAGLQAGFRESGALNITTSSIKEPATPMVGIRSMGLGLESIIGVESDGEMRALVPEWQVEWLLRLVNERFEENQKRIQRFRELLFEKKGDAKGRKNKHGEEWEDKDARRDRLKREGMERAEALRRRDKDIKHSIEGEEVDIGVLGI